MSNQPSHVHRIVAAIGEQAIIDALGVSKFAVRAAKRDKKFPALWYAAISELCRKSEAECPLSAFWWKGDERARPAEPAA